MSNPKLIIIKDLWFPTRQANAVQTIKMAEALNQFLPTTLWLPANKINYEETSQFNTAFDIIRPFPIDIIPTYYHPSTVIGIKNINSYLFKFTFYPNCFRKLINEKVDVIFSREPEAIIIGSFLNPKPLLILESHQVLKHPYDRFFQRLAMKKASIHIVTSSYLAERFASNQIPTLVLPNAIDQHWLYSSTNLDHIHKMRRQFAPRQKDKIILYAGSNKPWKGVGTLIKTAEIDTNPRHVYVFVGFKGKSTHNTRFIDRQTRNNLRDYLSIADCLVLPNTAKDTQSKYETSPLKLYEYMATRIPIIASDLPSITNIVDSKEVWFFTPDSPNLLLDTVNRVLTTPISQRRKKTDTAFQKVTQNTWNNRALQIVKVIKKYV